MTTELTNLDGPVWTPDTDGYDEARLGFQRLDPHRPAYVVGAASAKDVQSAVHFARENGLKVAVKAKGHGHLNPLDGGVLITTDRLNDVVVDPDTKTAWIEAGATWKQVIEAAAPHGLAPLSGSFPTLGAVPYILGGGLGLMARQYGYAADHVRRIELVTPDGVLRNAEDDPDLFWALRGGIGNFGIVTRLQIDLFEVTTLYGGSLYYDLSANPGALEAWREWTETVPDNVTSAVAVLRFLDIPHVPEPLRGKHVAQLQLSILDGGEELVRPLRKIGEPVVDTVGELPYTESAKIFAEPDRADAFSSRNVLLSALDPQALDTVRTGSDANKCVLAIRHLGGALAKEPEIANAMGHRDAQYSVTVLSIGEQDQSVRHRAVLEPFADQVVGRLLNFSSASLDEADLRAAFDEGDYAHLWELRARYDPDELLQPNHPL
ncbi:FAD/FMN-containing dehydrogenase [Kribbella voronezhensis]|uniref:FAD/FMN-containing dehydrogenase n=1 Tax=Kribbella voronezhensis TaxID=2512212 RepID=A0A4R7TEN6_9ACTN|nr:FAD-binding oxidoreductase [Kribbella voronezhensis]TDU89986.1 FAD/FMN-containing dehydrogenase [Kribbella voronezhensis]